MPCLRITRLGAPPELSALPGRPSAAPGHTIVRLAAAALGHLDGSVASGTFPRHPELPYIPCGDGAGWVEESAAFPPGALVWLRGGGLGVTRDGLAATYAVAPDEAVHLAPPAADPLLAACFFSPATSAYLAVHELAGIRAGQRVLVTGAAGSVGSLAVQLAVEVGAEVTGTVSRAERAAFVPGGITVLAGPDAGVAGPDAWAAGPDIRPGGGSPPAPYDVLIDTVGGGALPGRLDAVAPGGVAVIVGYTAGTTVELNLPQRCLHDVELRFLNMIRRAPQAFGLANGLLSRLSAGELTLRLERYPLEHAALAWTALASGAAAGRVVLEVPRDR